MPYLSFMVGGAKINRGCYATNRYCTEEGGWSATVLCDCDPLLFRFARCHCHLHCFANSSIALVNLLPRLGDQRQAASVQTKPPIATNRAWHVDHSIAMTRRCPHTVQRFVRDEQGIRHRIGGGSKESHRLLLVLTLSLVPPLLGAVTS
jgi:hypothetical protein